MTLTFRPADAADAPLIRALADRIWPICYGGMLAPGQITYMLNWMYAPHKLVAEMAAGVRYEIAWRHGRPAGYLALERRPERRATLHKLYLDSDLHGRGLGQEMLQWAFSLAAGWDCAEIDLRVNRSNARALKAYARAGFRQLESVCTDIGGGYLMDDLVLQRPLPAHQDQSPP